ncbi:PEP-CTERM/exosortase system-associated acyltransferase [Haliea sp. E1-2-M8]|uniref:PEP-CTERM/exosortase system-associated acyltransferase n=1 Tax=Haliea sp. E1-2-M8 TaxID=3064706 RepID=UPI002725307C|nr:PEP-CTERM/exosortase system-associated acyltransferase [Haliea sp. E1-2-M8]MDO8863757.1 PEP-CTERM/exosortase system-associated acyltransferase [Haliea sp. E1-2-M8]
MTHCEHFHKYFSVSLATTPEQRLSAHRLRFRVYCEEFRYLDPRDRPDEEQVAGIEVDEFDDRSIHCLVTHRRTGRAAGCVRVVTTRDNLYEDPLPLGKFCLPALSLSALDVLAADRSRVGEISRLAVDPVFRRRSGDHAGQPGRTRAVDINHQEVRSFSMIAVAALLGAAASSEMLGLTDVFAMMKPALPRLMRRSGLTLARAGQITDYHGRRAPYHMSAETYRRTMPAQLGNFYEELRIRLGSDVGCELAAMPEVRVG